MTAAPRHPLTRTDAALAAALATLAVLVRWPFCLTGATLLHPDKAIFGVMAQDILDGRSLPIYFYGQGYFGALEAYVVAALQAAGAAPLLALHLASALFFAALVAVQYLMLTRWFGRRGGLVAAGVLLAGSPFWVLWSVAARGGYVEVLLWGSALLWAYSEWYNQPRADPAPPPPHAAWRAAFFGWLLGSGYWINPAIVLFVLPIAVHALLNRPLAALHAHPAWGARLARADRAVGGWPVLLPGLVLLAVIAATSLFSVWVDNRGVHRQALLGLLPWPASGLVAAAIVLAIGGAVLLRTGLLDALRRHLPAIQPLIGGFMVGYLPAIVYTVSHALRGQPPEGTVPLGLRPLWTLGPPLGFLVESLPLALGSDPRGLLDLAQVGRAPLTPPFGAPAATALTVLNYATLVLLLCSVLLLARWRTALAAPLRLQPGPHAPVTLLGLAALAILGLFLLNAAVFDLQASRYLVPLWAIIPGLIAAGVATDDPAGRPPRRAWCAVPLALMACWTCGQAALGSRLGAPHPLQDVAARLQATGVPAAQAETLDAHLLSFFTAQRPPVAEFEPFWSRLAGLRSALPATGPRAYVVQPQEGPPAPPGAGVEWVRRLWPAIGRRLAERPGDLRARQPLGQGYELIVLDPPLAERPAN